MTWTCDTRNYPTVEEQRRFVRAYLNHRPQYNPLASSTPRMEGRDAPPGSIKEFMLDSRTPAGEREGSISSNLYAEEEARREQEIEKQVDEVLKEVRMWRLANSAQWVAWGIVQAQIPELDDAPPFVITPDEIDGPQNGILENANLDNTKLEKEDGREIAKDEQVKEEEDEFDYLGYAQSRALFFWGDVVGLGIMKKEELPKDLAEKIKVLDY